MINLVEMCSSDEESKWNQSCIYGHLIEGHSVYCHYDGKKFNTPRKCRRTWFTGGEPEHWDDPFDEDCPGYKRNPDADPKYLKENILRRNSHE